MKQSYSLAIVYEWQKSLSFKHWIATDDISNLSGQTFPVSAFLKSATFGYCLNNHFFDACLNIFLSVHNVWSRRLCRVWSRGVLSLSGRWKRTRSCQKRDVSVFVEQMLSFKNIVVQLTWLLWFHCVMQEVKNVESCFASWLLDGRSISCSVRLVGES